MTALVPRSHRASTAAGLVDAARDGDEQAWALLWEEHEGSVRGVALARLCDEHLAEDVVQETLLRAWMRLHQLEDPTRLGAWLRGIAANLAVDHVRSLRATHPLSAAAAVADDEPGPDDRAVAAEEAAVLHRHLRELRPEDRVALWQRDAHGVPVEDVAAMLDMTRGSTRVLLSRARRRLRDGYGAVAVPLLGLVDRLRTRLAGLGDAVPVAVAAPVVVVAVVAGVAGVGMVVTDEPVDPVVPASTSTAPDPVDASASDDRAVRPAPAAAASAPSVATGPTASDAAPRPTTPERRPTRVDLGQESVGFTRDAPTTDDRDVDESAPAGPVDGLEVYLEDTSLAGLEQTCVVCD